MAGPRALLAQARRGRGRIGSDDVPGRQDGTDHRRRKGHRSSHREAPRGPGRARRPRGLRAHDRGQPARLLADDPRLPPACDRESRLHPPERLDGGHDAQPCHGRLLRQQVRRRGAGELPAPGGRPQGRRRRGPLLLVDRHRHGAPVDRVRHLQQAARKHARAARQDDHAGGDRRGGGRGNRAACLDRDRAALRARTPQRRRVTSRRPPPDRLAAVRSGYRWPT